jgi:hypothetical protein
MRKFAADVPLATNNLLFYMVVVASAPFQLPILFLKAAPQTAEMSSATCAQSIFSCWSQAKDGMVCVENMSNSSEKLQKNFKGTSKQL